MIQKVKEKKVESQRFNDLGLRKQISSGIGELFGSFQADDRVLEAFIHNMVQPPIPEIHGYLQKLGLLVDGPVITRLAVILGKVDLYMTMLG
ncbi:hypothetical protein Gohar_013439, partial [Gossypium harknessii]|nr:hypothetical protein [Gossypium harknessii]